MTRRILFVAMQGSVHVARWIRQLRETGWDLHLFPVDSALPHRDLAGVTIHWPTIPLRPRSALQAWRGSEPAGKNVISAPMLPIPTIALPGRIAIRLAPIPPARPSLHGAFRAAMLARLIRQLRPDLVHSLEFQHAAYTTLWARERLLQRQGTSFPPWLATNWGSDIYYYRNFPDHRAAIERVLHAVDYYSCECERDVSLARELGFTGTALPVFPNTGGFDLERIAALSSGQPPAARRIIMVKGYQHFAGRAMIALDAIERCADLVKDYEIVVFSATGPVIPRVAAMAGRFPIRLLPLSSHETILRLFGQARAYLGVGISDAISTSLLEAMAMGAFPIQTNTSCCEEWIRDGESGFSIPHDDPEAIAAKLRRALTEDPLVNAAAAINARTVRARLDERVLRHETVALYDRMLGDAVQVI